ncbi:hypothetical protein [Caldalkalibacillus mannanilyticus]|uniref:hypothetical protein n=1 Tax=Caldalkalibacillus mannanilyticus TaxID=1418 RepID=UPI00046AAE7D|nr:hypothetical protein [Caldalkalibacillus mannanilyticus]
MTIAFFLTILGVSLTILAAAIGIKDFIIDQGYIRNGWIEVFLAILVVVALSTGIYSGAQSLYLIQGEEYLITQSYYEKEQYRSTMELYKKMVMEGIIIGYLSMGLYLYIRKKVNLSHHSKSRWDLTQIKKDT